jgi:hypothetical protein
MRLSVRIGNKSERLRSMERKCEIFTAIPCHAAISALTLVVQWMDLENVFRFRIRLTRLLRCFLCLASQPRRENHDRFSYIVSDTRLHRWHFWIRRISHSVCRNRQGVVFYLCGAFLDFTYLGSQKASGSLEAVAKPLNSVKRGKSRTI